MKRIRFDFNNMFSHNVGAKHGVTDAELEKISGAAKKAAEHINTIVADDRNRINLGLEWMRLPFQDKETIRKIQKMGDEIGKKYENVISLGIGGSYLGIKAAQDALCPPYYNEFPATRNGRSKPPRLTLSSTR